MREPSAVLLDEPPHSQADLSFRLFGFPVRITPWFWLVSLLFAWHGGDVADPRLIVAAVLAIFLSILIHELGHAAAFRWFGMSAHVVLYQFGGLAIPYAGSMSPRGRQRRNRFEQIVIAAAGPAAQLGAAVVLVLGLLLSGKAAPVGGFVGEWLLRFCLRLNLPLDHVFGAAPVFVFVSSFLFVSIYWALVNLLPIYPLDGGQIARELFLIWDKTDAIRHSLILSVAVGGVTAIWGFSSGDWYLGLLFGMLAYGSYTTLQSYLGQGGYGRW
jgi:Zn-dependent protease